MTTETKSTIELDREYTLEEYRALPDDGNRYELIEGRLVMTPAPRDRHGRITARLYDAIREYLRQNPAGEVWFNTGFYLGKKPDGKDNVPEPDLGFIVHERVPPESNQYLPYPDLAVEVWSGDSDPGSPSKLTRAREKLKMYMTAGARIVWGINPEDGTVEVYRPGQPPAVLNAEDELEGGDVIPGFRLKVALLFK